MLKIEQAFTRTRVAAENNSPHVQDEARELLTLIDQARRGRTVSGGFWEVFWLALLIIVREGFEATVVIAALLAVLKKMKQTHHSRTVHAGWISAIVAGALAFAFGHHALAGANRELLEGLGALAAVGMLIYAAMWLNARANIRKFMGELREKMQGALGQGSAAGLFAISFTAMFRESFETAVFLQGLAIDSGPGAAWGALGGVVVMLGLVLADQPGRLQAADEAAVHRVDVALARDERGAARQGAEGAAGGRLDSAPPDPAVPVRVPRDLPRRVHLLPAARARGGDRALGGAATEGREAGAAHERAPAGLSSRRLGAVPRGRTSSNEAGRPRAALTRPSPDCHLRDGARRPVLLWRRYVMADLPVRREGGSLSPTKRSWDPFERMRDILSWDPLLAFESRKSELERATFSPAFEVKETGDAILFSADMPGVQESDLEVSVQGNRLSISGKRESEKTEDTDRYYAYERSYGSFSRSFTLPDDVNPDAASAELKEGVFKLRLPKKAEVKAHKIKLGGAGASAQKAKA